MNTPFSDGVARIIKEKGLKQVYVAKRAGFTPQELCDMLNGQRVKPSGKKYNQLRIH